MGGAVAAVEQGFVQREIEEAAFRWNEQVESGERVIVGVNRFAEDGQGEGRAAADRPGRRAAPAGANGARAGRAKRRGGGGRARGGPPCRRRAREPAAADARGAPRPRHDRRDLERAPRRVRDVRRAARLVSPPEHRKFSHPQPTRPRVSQTMRSSTREESECDEDVIAVLLVCGVATATALASGPIDGRPGPEQLAAAVRAPVGERRVHEVARSPSATRSTGIGSSGSGRPAGVREPARQRSRCCPTMRSPTLSASLDHGATGAFVSKWMIAERSLRVAAGRDLISKVATWNAATSSHNAPAKGVSIGRLCSATSRPVRPSMTGALGSATTDRCSSAARKSATRAARSRTPKSGISWELPALGKYSFENAVANPATGRTNGRRRHRRLDPRPGLRLCRREEGDRQPGRAGRPHGRQLYGIKVPGVPVEPANTGVPSGTRVHRGGSRERLQPDGRADPGGERHGGCDGMVPAGGRGLGSHSTPTTSTSPSPRTSLARASCTGFVLQIPRTLRRAARSTSCSRGSRPGAPLSGSTCSTTSRSTPVATSMLQEDPGGQDYLARIWQYGI